MLDDSSPSMSTNALTLWVSELQAGRPNSAEPTLRRIVARVEQLAAAAFRKFPRVGRFVAVDDVVQGSLIRLLAALRQVRPNSTRHFYALTNELIRRELLDLTKHYFGPAGHGTNLADTPVGDAAGEVAPAAPDAAAELDRLAAFHEAVAALPAQEREVIGLTYYHGWAQAAVAELLGVTVRTVQRWHTSATERIRQRCGPLT